MSGHFGSKPLRDVIVIQSLERQSSLSLFLLAAGKAERSLSPSFEDKSCRDTNPGYRSRGCFVEVARSPLVATERWHACISAWVARCDGFPGAAVRSLEVSLLRVFPKRGK